MGCVSYPIEVGQLKVPEYVRQSGGVVRFPADTKPTPYVIS